LHKFSAVNDDIQLERAVNEINALLVEHIISPVINKLNTKNIKYY